MTELQKIKEAGLNVSKVQRLLEKAKIYIAPRTLQDFFDKNFSSSREDSQEKMNFILEKVEFIRKFENRKEKQLIKKLEL